MSDHEKTFDMSHHLQTREVPVAGKMLLSTENQELGVIKEVDETKPWWGGTLYRVILEDNQIFNVSLTEEAQKKPEKKPEPWWTSTQDRPALVSQSSHHEEAQNEKEQNARDAYFGELLAAQITKDYFPHSTTETNPDLIMGDEVLLNKLYEQYLKAYNNSSLSQSPISPDKIDYLEERSDAGHKVHLNVASKDVVAVAEYLKQQGYRHKYLSGGEILDGKVFTVYMGSKDLANKLAQVISHDLEPYLKRPVIEGEVEYAPNVVGRFDEGNRRDFTQYGHGIRGVNMLEDDAQIAVGVMFGRTTPVTRSEIDAALPDGFIGAFKRSFERLASDYGSFFYGTNEISHQ